MTVDSFETAKSLLLCRERVGRGGEKKIYKERYYKRMGGEEEYL